MRRKIYSLMTLLLFSGASLFAQSESTDAPVDAPADKYENWKNRHALGLSAGLPGFGIDYSYNLNRSFNVRAGFLMFGLSDLSMDMEISGQSVNLNNDISSSVYDLMFEYHPSSNVAFKLVAGIGYLDGVGVNSVVLLNNGINYGDLVFTNEDIGEIDMNITWSGIAPYIGFGFGRAIPLKRVGFGLEFGSYYAGGPDVEITATNFLENTSREAEEMEENLASYAWMPRVMARLAIKL